MVLCIFGSYFLALRKLLNSACLFISCIFGVWDYFATFSLSCLYVGLNGQVSKKEETKTGSKDYCFHKHPQPTQVRGAKVRIRRFHNHHYKLCGTLWSEFLYYSIQGISEVWKCICFRISPRMWSKLLQETLVPSTSSLCKELTGRECGCF